MPIDWTIQYFRVLAQNIQVVNETIQPLSSSEVRRIMDLDRVIPADNLCRNKQQFQSRHMNRILGLSVLLLLGFLLVVLQIRKANHLTP